VESRRIASLLKQQMGIETIFYEILGEDHSGRDAVLDKVMALVRELGEVETEPREQPIRPPATGEAPGWARKATSELRERIDQRED
jgi:hypothetical protein